MTCAGYLLSAFLGGAFASFAWARLRQENKGAAKRTPPETTPHHPV